MIPEHFIAIDEEGFPLIGDAKVTDPGVGGQILSTLAFAENGALIAQAGIQHVLVEAFDDPLIAQSLTEPIAESQPWTANFLFRVTFHFRLESLTIDEWDRFHGTTEKGISFVMSRKAQAAFFDQLDEFDDESITFQGQHYSLPPWLSSNPEIRKDEYWSKIYQTEEPGWELNQASPAFLDMMPRLKIPKARVLVLGCGSGNDAAYFAELGHVVTALDFSAEAIARAQSKYGHLKNLKFMQKDIFTIDTSWTQQFDLIVEHTLYCAIPPEKRGDLVALWKRLLVPGGQMIAVFFTMERKKGPPFGASEWELRSRLQKAFQFQFWGRWRQSIQRRNGKELFVFATKKT